MMTVHVSKSRILLSCLLMCFMVFAMFKWTNLKNIGIVYMNSGPDISQKKIQGKVQEKVQEKNPQTVGLPMPTLEVLKTFDRRQLSQIYHNYVNSIQFSCKKMVRRGNVADGGWDVCEDPPYNIKTPCNIYSFGINYDWSFDDAVATAYGCQIHSYDPSMTKVKDHDRRPNLHFHRTGLNTSDETNKMGWRMRTFSSILKENGHSQAVIDLLKIDIDYSEWWAFPEMLKSGALKNVKQFCFEIHVKLRTHPEPDIGKYLKGLELLRNFYQAGYRIFHTNKNMDAKYKSMFGMERTGCHEIYMVRNDTHTFG